MRIFNEIWWKEFKLSSGHRRRTDKQWLFLPFSKGDYTVRLPHWLSLGQSQGAVKESRPPVDSCTRREPLHIHLKSKSHDITYMQRNLLPNRCAMLHRTRQSYRRNAKWSSNWIGRFLGNENLRDLSPFCEGQLRNLLIDWVTFGSGSMCQHELWQNITGLKSVNTVARDNGLDLKIWQRFRKHEKPTIRYPLGMASYGTDFYCCINKSMENKLARGHYHTEL